MSRPSAATTFRPIASSTFCIAKSVVMQPTRTAVTSDCCCFFSVSVTLTRLASEIQPCTPPIYIKTHVKSRIPKESASPCGNHRRQARTCPTVRML